MYCQWATTVSAMTFPPTIFLLYLTKWRSGQIWKYGKLRHLSFPYKHQEPHPVLVHSNYQLLNAYSVSDIISSTNPSLFQPYKEGIVIAISQGRLLRHRKLNSLAQDHPARGTRQSQDSNKQCGSRTAHRDHSMWRKPVPGIQGGSSFDCKPGGGTSCFALETTVACQEATDRGTMCFGATEPPPEK